MTENEAYKVFEDVEIHGDGILAEGELKDAAAVFLNMIAELKRFRAREPLVQALVEHASALNAGVLDDALLNDAAKAVRDFTYP
jgi:hypothetical protein